MNLTWKHFAPVVVAIVIALDPRAAGGCRSMHGITSRFSSAS